MFEKDVDEKNLAKSYNVMVSTIGINMAYLESQSTITRIVSNLDKKESFSMKSIGIEFCKYLGIRSCLRDL